MIGQPLLQPHVLFLFGAGWQNQAVRSSAESGGEQPANQEARSNLKGRKGHAGRTLFSPLDAIQELQLPNFQLSITPSHFPLSFSLFTPSSLLLPSPALVLVLFVSEFVYLGGLRVFDSRDTHTMSRFSNRSGASKPFTAWTTVFYLLLVFIAPLALLGTAHAQEDETPQENYGTGTTSSDILWSHKLTDVSSYRY